MGKFIRIGVDLAKNYFQVHVLASEGAPAVKRKLTRSKMHRFFSQIEPSFIGMEACGSAHYWARELKAMGHEVRPGTFEFTSGAPGINRVSMPSVTSLYARSAKIVSLHEVLRGGSRDWAYRS